MRCLIWPLRGPFPQKGPLKSAQNFLLATLESDFLNLIYSVRDAEVGSRNDLLAEFQEFMTMTSAFSLAPLFRHSVGFDRFNELFESAARNEAGSSYPPYNVEKHGDDH